MSVPIIECPICMDAIDASKNNIITDCGHTFHCSCLMQNVAHNGFGCPYCRSAMANEPPVEEDEDEDDYDISIDANQEISDYSLTSFRMFMQLLDGEEPEEEPEEDDDWEDEEADDDEADDDEAEDEEAEEESAIPDASYMAEKLMERGVTYEDLVKSILFQEHSNWGFIYTEYERRSAEVYGKFRAIKSRYTRDCRFRQITIRDTSDIDVPAEAPLVVPEPVAETKSAAIHRRCEFMYHV